jgi:hypothetical protein
MILFRQSAQQENTEGEEEERMEGKRKREEIGEEDGERSDDIADLRANLRIRFVCHANAATFRFRVELS